MHTVVLIPAYRPDRELVTLVKKLAAKQFRILVVDDGSGSDYAPVFRDAEAFAMVLHCRQNGGKGSALKFGMAQLQELFPDCRYFVTADADGQHSVADIVRVADALDRTGSIILGSRRFTGKVPLRSAVGNLLSRYACCISTGRYLVDNQSGLRGFRFADVEWMQKVPGSRYDYEINVLLHACRRNRPMLELPIQTIYLNENASSHFRPIPDTLLLHRMILLASVPAILAVVLSWLAVFFAEPYLPQWAAAAVGLGGGCLLHGLLNVCLGYGIPRQELMSGLIRRLLSLASLWGMVQVCPMPIWALLTILFIPSTVAFYWLSKLGNHICGLRAANSD